MNVSRWKHRRLDTPMVKWVGEGKGWIHEVKQSAKHLVKKISEIPNQKPRQLDRTGPEDPVTDEGVQVEISGLTVTREHSSVRREIPKLRDVMHVSCLVLLYHWNPAWLSVFLGSS